MEIAKLLIPIACAFIGAFINQPIIYFTNLILRRKLKKIENAIESLKLFETYETQFKTEFILPDLKETYFYVQTGIQTNEKSIEKYIKFKNELSGNYTWKQIRIAQSYLNLSTERIEIKLNKIEKIGSNILLIIALSMITIPFVLFPIFIDTSTNIFRYGSLKIIALTILPCLAGYILVSWISPIIMAKAMEKKLKHSRQR